MAFVPPKSRVLETSITNHQTVWAVGGALDTSYYPFSNYMSVGDTTEGAVVEPGVAFKAGILTYSAANQITITTTDFSKGTFGAGTKEIFMGPRATNWAEMFDSATGLSNRLRFDAPQTLDAGQKSQARSNISLGDSATKNTGTTAGTVAAGDDSRIKIAGTTAGTLAAGDDSRITGAAQKSANLSDLASAATARINLNVYPSGGGYWTYGPGPIETGIYYYIEQDFIAVAPTMELVAELFFQDLDGVSRVVGGSCGIVGVLTSIGKSLLFGPPTYASISDGLVVTGLTVGTTYSVWLSGFINAAATDSTLTASLRLFNA